MRRRAKHSLERLDQTAVLRSALLHAERLQHFGTAVECNGLALLANGRRGEVKRHEAVPSPGQSVAGMAGYLQQELAVSTFVQQDGGGGRFTGKPQSTKGREANPRVWLAVSRFSLTSSITPARRSFCFDMTRSGWVERRMAPAGSKPPRCSVVESYKSVRSRADFAAQFGAVRGRIGVRESHPNDDPFSLLRLLR